MNRALTKLYAVIVLTGLVLFGVLKLAYCDDKDPQGIKITNAWIRLMPPSERTSAAVLEINNNTDKPMVLESATSQAVGKIELHQMSRVNGMMKMAMVKGITIPPRGKVSLEEEGYHLMLIDLAEALKKDQRIPILLHFKDGVNVSVNVVVASEMPQSQGNVDEGRNYYLSFGCAVCHGLQGDGEGINAKNYDPLPTNFHNPKKYLLGAGKKDIIYKIKNGSGSMPKYNYLSSQEIEAMADYLVSLQDKGNK